MYFFTHAESTEYLVFFKTFLCKNYESSIFIHSHGQKLFSYTISGKASKGIKRVNLPRGIII